MCLINYLSACRRLKEYDKFIKLNGKDSLPDQLMAQRDMIELEKKYYGIESLQFVITILICIIVLVPIAIYFRII